MMDANYAIWFALRRAAITREVRKASHGLMCWLRRGWGDGARHATTRSLLPRRLRTNLTSRTALPPPSSSLPQEAAIADRWLEALQVCQVAFVLLLRELDSVEANLKYWHHQEQRGGHFWSQLLRRVRGAAG